MQTKETSPLMHFPLVDALAPPLCQPKGTERHKFWSKLRKLCQNPIYLQLPTATCTQLPHMPSRRLAQCNLQRRVPPILPPPRHVKLEKVALSSSPNIVLLAKAQRGINSGGEGVAWAASRNLQRIPREGSQILCLCRLRLCPT